MSPKLRQVLLFSISIAALGCGASHNDSCAPTNYSNDGNRPSSASVPKHSPVGKWVQKDIYNEGRNHRTTELTFFAEGRFESSTEANAGLINYQSEITGTWELGANSSIRLVGTAISGSGNQVTSDSYARVMKLGSDGLSISDGPELPEYHRVESGKPTAPQVESKSSTQNKAPRTGTKPRRTGPPIEN